MNPPRYSGKKFFIFYTNQLVSLSPWLPLMRELPSISEAEGEKDYPSVACGASSPDKGSQERGKAWYVPICHTNYKAFSHGMANFSKTKNRGDVHETHPPGLMNKSDENNQRTFFLLQKNHTKELMHSFPPQQRLQLIHEYGILSSRRCRKSGWWLCARSHNLSGNVERQFNKSAGAFFFPAGRRTIFTFFVILAYPRACVKSFCKK